MNIEEIKEKIVDIMMNPDIEETGKMFTEKDVARVICVATAMVGDPRPGSNEDVYRTVLERLNLPDPVYVHLLQMVLAARAALKDALRVQMLHSLGGVMMGKSCHPDDEDDGDDILQQLKDLINR